MKVRSLADLEKLQAEGLDLLYSPRLRINVGMATCGRAAGAAEVFEAIRDEAAKRGLDVYLVATGCLGYCQREPLVDVRLPGKGRVLYQRVTPQKARRLVEALSKGELPADGALAVIRREESPTDGKVYRFDGSLPPEFAQIPALDELPFYAHQRKLILRNCGLINPQDIRQYIARGGYLALAKALLEMTPREVIEEVSRSGLRGRGGAGFPTGRKWQVARDAPGEPKYVICNGDEGDPGAYMDRTVLESDPHSVIEGMVIAGYAIGAHQGYAYIRHEYPLAVEQMAQAVAEAESLGLLGEDILGTGFDFTITIVEGAGAFVCGEETALIA